MLKLNKLSVKNFKNIEDLSFAFDGNIVNIIGDNEKGKTTLFDAWSWLVNGKDSAGRADFAIKPMGKNIDSEVTAVILYEAKEIELKKQNKEKWTKRRGESEKTLTGHTIKYYIDEVPLSKTKYDKRVKEIFGTQDQARLLTDLTYFLGGMKWKDRRDLLVEIAGDVDMDAVIEEFPDMEPAKNLIGSKKVDDVMAKLKDKRTSLRKEIDEYPARIDEAGRNIELPEKSVEELEARIGELKDKAAELQAKIKSDESPLEKVEAQARDLIKEIEAEEKALKRQREIIDKKRYMAKREAEIKQEKIENKIAELVSSLRWTEKEIKHKKDQLETIKAKWKEVRFQKLDTVCDKCGQKIPEDKYENLKKEFNRQKAEALDKINKEGMEVAEHVKTLEAKAEKIRDKIKKLKKEMASIQPVINADEKEIDTSKLEKLQEKYKKLLEKRDEFYNTSEESLKDKYRLELEEIDREIVETQKQIFKYDEARKQEERIQELKKERIKLVRKLEKIEADFYLVEEYIKKKARLLTNKINSLFSYVQFRLFNELVDGTPVPCCEGMVRNVPYRDLSNSQKIKAGLECCEILGKHFGKHLPIWIDNAESIISIPETTAQQIRLYPVAGAELSIKEEINND